MLAHRKTGIYRELSSYWSVLRQNETANTHGLNHKDKIRVCGPEKDRQEILGSLGPASECWALERAGVDLGMEEQEMQERGGQEVLGMRRQAGT
jgi:hypothetical protein